MSKIKINLVKESATDLSPPRTLVSCDTVLL